MFPVVGAAQLFGLHVHGRSDSELHLLLSGLPPDAFCLSFWFFGEVPVSSEVKLQPVVHHGLQPKSSSRPGHAGVNSSSRLSSHVPRMGETDFMRHDRIQGPEPGKNITSSFKKTRPGWKPISKRRPRRAQAALVKQVPG